MTVEQQVKIDDYTITLKEVIIENDVPKGYYMFEVTKENYDMRDLELLEELIDINKLDYIVVKGEKKWKKSYCLLQYVY